MYKPRVSAGGRTHRNIDVYARFRPTEQGQHSVMQSANHLFSIEHAKRVSLGHRWQKSDDFPFKEKTFETDLVFDDQATQLEVYRVIGDPIVKDVIQGFNSCILCYGQTGSGKTHSLFGDMSNAESPMRGLVPRCIQKIFEHISRANDIEEVVVKCSFIGIYNNKLQDLLMPNGEKKLKIREKIDGAVYVQGIHEEYVNSFDDVYDVLQIGFRNRTVTASEKDIPLSRTNCVLTLRVKTSFVGGENKVCRVHFGDLAGSERGKSGGMSKSLKALTKVVRALGTESRKRKGKSPPKIPYRDSKLTQILKEALGGNSKSAMLFTCSMEVLNYRETVRTLMLAERCKLVRNKFKVNKEMSNKELMMMIELYKRKLAVANDKIKRMREVINNMDFNRMNLGHIAEDMEKHPDFAEKIEAVMAELRKEIVRVLAEAEKADKVNDTPSDARLSIAIDAAISDFKAPPMSKDVSALAGPQRLHPQQGVGGVSDSWLKIPSQSGDEDSSERQDSFTSSLELSRDSALMPLSADDLSRDSAVPRDSELPKLSMSSMVEKETMETIANLKKGIAAKDSTIDNLNEENARLRAEIYARKEEVLTMKKQVSKEPTAEMEYDDKKQDGDGHDEEVIADMERERAHDITSKEAERSPQKLDEKERLIMEEEVEEEEEKSPQEKEEANLAGMRLEKIAVEREKRELIRWNKVLQTKYDDLVRKYEGIDMLLGVDDEEQPLQDVANRQKRRRRLSSGPNREDGDDEKDVEKGLGDVDDDGDDGTTKKKAQRVPGTECRNCVVHCYAKRTKFDKKKRMAMIMKILALVFSVFCAIFIGWWLVTDCERL